MTAGTDPTVTFADNCGYIRTQIKELGKLMMALKDSIKTRPEVAGQDTPEMIANVTLAYRHIEDAAMRIGKAIQAYEGGKSIYDNNDATRAARAEKK